MDYGRATLSPILGRAEVVAGEPPGGAAHLQDHKRDEHHADEHMRCEQGADPQNRQSFGAEHDEEHDGHRCGEPRVGLHTTLATKATPRGHVGWPNLVRHGA